MAGVGSRGLVVKRMNLTASERTPLILFRNRKACPPTLQKIMRVYWVIPKDRAIER
jgi:hypothetical protein